jgi:hypothetical protein
MYIACAVIREVACGRYELEASVLNELYSQCLVGITVDIDHAALLT